MLACRRCLVQLLTHKCRTCTIADLSKCLVSLPCFYLFNFLFFLGVGVSVFVSLVLFLDCDFLVPLPLNWYSIFILCTKSTEKKKKHITWIYMYELGKLKFIWKFSLYRNDDIWVTKRKFKQWWSINNSTNRSPKRTVTPSPHHFVIAYFEYFCAIP